MVEVLGMMVDGTGCKIVLDRKGEELLY